MKLSATHVHAGVHMYKDIGNQVAHIEHFSKVTVEGLTHRIHAGVHLVRHCHALFVQSSQQTLPSPSAPSPEGALTLCHQLRGEGSNISAHADDQDIYTTLTWHNPIHRIPQNACIQPPPQSYCLNYRFLSIDLLWRRTWQTW